MTDIEAKALALVNELAAIYAKRAFTVSEPHLSGYRVLIGFDRSADADAFFHSLPTLEDFIIPKPKPDPLVEVMKRLGWYDAETDAADLRVTLADFGLEIREKGQ